MPPSISAPIRAAAMNFGGYLGPLYNFFCQKKNGTVGQSLHGQIGSNFPNVDHFDRKQQFSGFSLLAPSIL